MSSTENSIFEILPNQKNRQKMELPENWRDELEKLQHHFNEMREKANQIPAKYNMTKEEFEAYLQNPSNFSPEEWRLITEARQEAQNKFWEIETTLTANTFKKTESIKNKMKIQSKKSWISMG